MKKLSVLLAAALLAAALAGCSSSRVSGFHGMNWGASRADVIAQFGEGTEASGGEFLMYSDIGFGDISCISYFWFNGASGGLLYGFDTFPAYGSTASLKTVIVDKASEIYGSPDSESGDYVYWFDGDDVCLMVYSDSSSVTLGYFSPAYNRAVAQMYS